MVNGISVTIDNKDVYKKIEDLIRKVNKPEPLLKIIGKYIQAQTKKMFVGNRPDTNSVRGEKWMKLKSNTIAKKKLLIKRGKAIGNPHRPLLETGALRDDLMSNKAIKINRKGLVYGTDRKKKDVAYPAIHQIGGRNIPKRRWLFLNNNELMQIAVTVRDWLVEKRIQRIV